MPLPPVPSGLSQSDLRRRLRASDPDTAFVPLPETRESGLIPRLDVTRRSGPIPRLGDSLSRTPLPGELPLTATDIDQLRAENIELRGLIEQAITQEEENERKARSWLAQMEERDR